MSGTIRLNLEGLTCSHCTGRVKTTLERRDDVTRADVTLKQARVISTATAEALIADIQKSGYQATLAEDIVPGEPDLPIKHQSGPKVVTAAQPAELNTDNLHYLLIEDMSCASCVGRVEKALNGVAGVKQVRINLGDRSALVLGFVDAEMLVSAVNKVGYRAQAVKNETIFREKQHASAAHSVYRFAWQSALALLTGILLIIWGMTGSNMILTDSNQRSWLATGMLTLVVMILAGGHYYRNAWRNLCSGITTMDTLVALGTGIAWLYSLFVNLWPRYIPPEARHLYYEASVMIIGLINLGHLLEQRARQHASGALERLADLAPPVARVVENGREQQRPLNQVNVGMTLRVTPGDKVPVDGVIVQGEVWLDEAMLTGEVLPQHKSVDDRLSAGTLVQDGSALFRASAVGTNTMLAHIIHLVRQAQSSKSELGRMADRVSAVFVPTVIAIALISAIIWGIVGPEPKLIYSLVVATTTLIIACPCALGLATPMAVITGIGRAAELGVIVRDADALQRASEIDTLVFDKTGTLTEGKPKVVATEVCHGVSLHQAIRWAAALGQNSGHPLAQAIVRQAPDSVLPEVTHFRQRGGLGVSGVVDRHHLLLGSGEFLSREGIDTAQIQAAHCASLAAGATPVFLAADNQAVAIFILSDQLRSRSIPALSALRSQGYRLVMLTGDNEATARALAKQAGIEHVIAGVHPEGKAAAIGALQHQGYRVAMIGDGINDAPALAQAELGMAMGSGSAIAIESAGITLMRPDISSVTDALAISRATLRNMKQNLLGAFFYNICSIPLAAGVLWPFTGTLLNPIIAGAAMALSSITVIANANRLQRFRTHQKH